MDQSQELHSSPFSVNSSKRTPSNLIIGYYNLRGKAQVPRLLLQYLQIDYYDRIFSLPQWQKFCAQETQDFAFPVLPFLREGSFVCTDSVPMCSYIINRFGDQSLLGKNLKDRAIIEMYFWTIPYMETVISINSVEKDPQKLRAFKENQWRMHVYPRLIKLQEYASSEKWFLGYLTIIDFSIYELVRYMDNIFENRTDVFPKLKRIERDFGEIQSIKQYEISSRAVVEWCPTKLLESFRAMMAQQQQKNNQNNKGQSKVGK